MTRETSTEATDNDIASAFCSPRFRQISLTNTCPEHFCKSPSKLPIKSSYHHTLAYFTLRSILSKSAAVLPVYIIELIISTMPPTRDIQYAPPGSYLAHQHNSKLLLYWISRTAHSILKHCHKTRPDCLLQLLDELKAGLPEHEGSKELQADPARAGFFTWARLVGFCRFIGAHIDFVPPSIAVLFLNVINTKLAAFTTWKAFTARLPRAKNTAELNAFGADIRTLWKAFNALRGFRSTEAPLADRIISSISSDVIPGSEEDINSLVPDEFPIRVVEDRTERQDKSNAEVEAEFYKFKAILPPDDLPLHHFDIGIPAYYDGILNANGNFSGLAVYDLFKEFVRLRKFLNDTWKEVIYDGLNSAVAVAVSFAAINLVNKYYVDTTPERLHYINMIRYFTDYQNSKSYVQPFPVSAYRVRRDGSCSEKFQRHVEVKEMFMIYTFESIVEFIAHFHATQDGKPTERMANLLQNWDPNIDLTGLTEEEYLRWRHLYTIKLLYSLDELALSLPSIANLAMGKTSPTGDSIKWSIEPTEVFLLQLMVDSFTASRGWLYDPIRGPIFVQPPSANVFLPARDLALFAGVKLDDSANEVAEGIPQLEIPQHYLGKAFEVCFAAKEFQSGKHNQGTGKTFLCGCSPNYCAEIYVQALWESHSINVWTYSINDVSYLGFYREPVLLVHLHNMLVREGYLMQSSRSITFLETYFDSLLSKEAKTLQDSGHYEQALSNALQSLHNPLPLSTFERLVKEGYRTEQLGCLANLQRLMVDITENEKRRVVQVKGQGSSNDVEHIIKGSRGRAKAVMDGIQAVGFELKELVPGTMLEGPGNSKIMVSLRDVLELLKADVTLGLHGSRCPDAMDRLWITSRANRVLEHIEGELAAARDPLFLKIYGDPPAKEDENAKESGGGGNEAGGVKTLAGMRQELVLRLLSRRLDVPGTKKAIEVAAKAFDDEELVEFQCLYKGFQGDSGRISDEMIRKRLEKGLAKASCPVM